MTMEVIQSDFSILEGTNCYCSEESAAQIRQAISGLPLSAVHMIGTGDYHYITLFWLERIREPFSLVLFDNHPDDQPSAFSPDTLSCGSWVAEARKLPNCIGTYWLSGAACETAGKNLRYAHPSQADAWAPPVHETTGGHGFSRLSLRKPGKPVYVSIDLDVLSRDYARTDWDQGSMTLEELSGAILELKKSSQIIGVDICGGLTIQKGASSDDLAINAATENALISLFEE